MTVPLPPWPRTFCSSSQNSSWDLSKNSLRDSRGTSSTCPHDKLHIYTSTRIRFYSSIWFLFLKISFQSCWNENKKNSFFFFLFTQTNRNCFQLKLHQFEASCTQDVHVTLKPILVVCSARQQSWALFADVHCQHVLKQRGRSGTLNLKPQRTSASWWPAPVQLLSPALPWKKQDFVLLKT